MTTVADRLKSASPLELARMGGAILLALGFPNPTEWTGGVEGFGEEIRRTLLTDGGNLRPRWEAAETELRRATNLEYGNDIIAVVLARLAAIDVFHTRAKRHRRTKAR